MKKTISFLIRYLYAAISCLYLFTIGIFFPRNRSLINEICFHFGQIGLPARIIPQIELAEVIPGTFPVQILEPVGVEGNITPLELIVVTQIVKAFDPERIFEIGTFDGRTTLNLAANCREQAKVFTLDLPKENLRTTKLPLVPGDKGFIDKETSGSKYIGTNYEKKITQLYGDSATFDFSLFFNSMDFVFVDGSHSYEYVLHDSKQSLRLLKNGKGIIIWHDYGSWEGATQALNELYSNDRSFKELKHIKGTSLACLFTRLQKE